ncbi:MAG: peptide chain release factor 1 [Chthoniobacterales bacterium]|nr:peptide chain release factor 1 [Chthoniobacterales bacterium]
MDLAPLIAKKRERLAQLEIAISSDSLYADPAKAREVMREHARAKELVGADDEVARLRVQLRENEELTGGGDAELAELAAAEIPQINERLANLDRDIQLALLPPDESEERNAVVEIRAGTGGDEAALFAADLYRMYQRYADTHGLRIEPVDSSPSGLGGFKEVVFKVTGDAVFRRLRYESGVHRVQRVPATEAQGRIHTSTATVAVLPEAQEVDVELRPQDLRIEVCRSGGPGGQGVNTTDSAVQILHIPTGKIVRCQDGRSQQKNKAAAMEILRTRLLEDKRNEEEAKYSAHRRSLIGRAGREEKIRTYNFPQNRVTDHRIGVTLYNLDRFMEGDLEEMVGALQHRDMEDRLAEAGLA